MDRPGRPPVGSLWIDVVDDPTAAGGDVTEEPHRSVGTGQQDLDGAGFRKLVIGAKQPDPPGLQRDGRVRLEQLVREIAGGAQHPVFGLFGDILVVHPAAQHEPILAYRLLQRRDSLAPHEIDTGIHATL